MGIIRLKKDNAGNAAAQTAVSEGTNAVIAENVAQEWADPAVLGEDEAHIDAYSRHYYLNNGTAKSVISASPVNYRDEETGKWRTIDNTLSEKTDCYEANFGKFKASVGKVSSGKKVSLSGKEISLTWEYMGASAPVSAKAMNVVNDESMEAMSAENAGESTLEVTASQEGAVGSKESEAIYKNASPAVNLEYRFSGNNVKENIVVKEKAEEYRYLFRLDTQGLKLRLSEDNANLELYSEKTKENGDKEEVLEFTIPSPYMYDANEAASEEVYYELEPEENVEGKYAFAVVADADWMNAPDRVFPVTIDPQILTSNSTVITKQVQRQLISSSSGSGAVWVNVQGDIKAGTESGYRYQTKLTVNCSKLSMLEKRIVSAKLVLKPIGSFEQVFVLQENSRIITCTLFPGQELRADITSYFISTPFQDVTFYLINDGTIGAFDATPVLEVEYITNEDVIPTRKTFTVAGAGTAEIDLLTGGMIAGFCDVSAENSIMGMEISHVYRRSGEEHLAGKNFRLSIDESFVKNGNSDLSTTYVYTDTKGEKHGFKDYYYYINTNGEKSYISKTDVSVETDGTLKYSGYEVTAEYRSQTGLKAVTQLDELNNIELLEQRSDEYKQLDEQVKSYENAYKEFVLMDTDTGDILNNTPSQEEIFDNLTDTKMMLPKSEALQYKSLIKNKNDLSEIKSFGYILPDAYSTKEVNERNLSLESSIDEISVVLKAYIEQNKNMSVASSYSYINSCLSQGFVVDVNSFKTIFPDEKVKYYEYTTGEDSEPAADDPTMRGKDLWAQFRQRNLLIYQLIEQEDDILFQQKLLEDQINLIKSKKSSYLEQLRSYYREYKNKFDELELMKRQMSVNYLTDGTIIKGYNEEGNLVAVYDNYENYAMVEYEAYRNASGGTKYRIKSLYDNNNKQVSFAYRPSDNLLETITDTRGRRAYFAYNDDKNLQVIRRDDGTELTLSYNGGRLQQVTNGKTNDQTVFTYNGGKIYKISTLGKAVVATDEEQLIQEASYSEFAYTTDGVKVSAVIIKEKSGDREKYIFGTDGNCTAHYVEQGGKVTSAEQYEYVPYWKGTEKQTNPHRTVKQAKKEALYQSALESFTFEADYTETAELNEFEKVSKITTSAKPISELGPTTLNALMTVVDYTYDNEQRVTEEKTKETYTPLGTSWTKYKKYYYNPQGSVIRTESWTEDEENTTGRSIEETVYDEKGNVVKSFTYNSLDSGSKFYTESEYAEDGSVTADMDATGEYKTKYEYVPGTNIVRTEVYPNGSKLSYGHDLSDTVTSITQSTEEGEENSNQTIYTCGKATEIRSGNNVVTYEYDHKGRITKVGLNGTDYLETKYSDGSGSNNDVITSKYVPREADNLSDIFEVTKNKHGDVICVKYGKANKAVDEPMLTEEYTYEYDGKFRVTKVKKGSTDLEIYDYDTLDRETKHEFNGHIHKTEYGDYGEVEKEVIEYDGSTTDKTEYTYSYSEDSARRLTGQTADGYTESYETDCLGRSRKVTQTLGGKTYSKRYGYYKAGDHATNLINTIYYGKDGKTSGKETYTYDGMGNIVSVSRDGKQKKAYTYDALNRIISEKDIDKSEEICYTYDNNGNILTKSVNGAVTSYAYEEGTDRLTSYGAETIGYDGMGNPKSYRGSELTWEKGRRLTSIKEGPEEVTFGYDVFGQRNKKTAGGETTNYIYENGKLLRQITGSEVMTFIYGSEGIIGFKLGTSRYLYRKNVFGDVEEIYDESGTLVGKYSYTAFGECEIETDVNGIATKNPIRYRGYYFDEETGFYYLKTRYYDPETGRFITIDDVSYLAPDTINGLNLYAYCGNNPVMNVDPAGESLIDVLDFFFSFFTNFFLKSSESYAELEKYYFKVIQSLSDDIVIRGDLTLTKIPNRLKMAYQGLRNTAITFESLSRAGKNVFSSFGKMLVVVQCVYTVFQNFSNSNLSLQRKVTDSIVDIGAILAGVSIGAKIGGAIGNMIPLPGIGTLIGVVMGGLIGGFVTALYSSQVVKDAFYDVCSDIGRFFSNIGNKLVNGWNRFLNWIF